MRLGDLDALEADFYWRCDKSRDDALTFDQIKEVIDNAPTVEIPKTIQQAINFGIFHAENQRPQGEWIYGEDDCGQDGWFCSECGFFVPWYSQYYEKDINFIRDYKACPHCMSEMITYTNKDRGMRGNTE